MRVYYAIQIDIYIMLLNVGVLF